MKKTIYKYLLLLGVLVVALLSLVGCGKELSQVNANSTKTEVSQSSQAPTGTLKIHVLDIGQGDAILIQIGDKFSMIDTGDTDHRPQVVALLKKYGVKELENVILTHPHADHIGGFYAIAKSIPIKHVYDNGIEIDNGTYRTYLKMIETKNIHHETLHKGDRLDLGNGAYFEVYAPWKGEVLTDKKGEVHQNNNSIVGKLTFGKFSMLMTGDAEKEEEARLIKEQNTKMSSKILKVGHHGSNGSSQTDFIRSIRPEVAVISAGLHNSYGHPGEKAMARLLEEHVDIYRTDTMGTITIRTDGTKYDIQQER